MILSLGVTLGAVCSKREMSLANFGPLKLKLQNMDSMDSMDLRIPERCGEKCLDLEFMGDLLEIYWRFIRCVEISGEFFS